MHLTLRLAFSPGNEEREPLCQTDRRQELSVLFRDTWYVIQAEKQPDNERLDTDTNFFPNFKRSSTGGGLGLPGWLLNGRSCWAGNETANCPPQGKLLLQGWRVSRKEIVFLGRARLQVELALWSHICVIIVVGVKDPPPPHHHNWDHHPPQLGPLTTPPPQLGPPTTTTTTHPPAWHENVMDGWGTRPFR